MSVSLERYQPLLDPTLDVIDELVKNRECDLFVPDHPDAVGLAIDMQSLIFHLYPYIDTEVSVPRAGQTIVIPGGKEENLQNLLLKIHFTKDSFELKTENNLSHYTIIDIQNGEKRADYGSKISVRAKKNFFKRKLSPLGLHLRRKGMPPPPEKGTIALSFAYESVKPFYISTLFQDFEPSTQDRTPSYPVSSKESHQLPYQTWDLIMKPLFWASWGFYQFYAFVQLTGEKQIQELVSPDQVEYVERRIPNAIPIIYQLMETLLEGGRLGNVLRRIKANNEFYIGLTLHGFLRGFSNLVNPDSLSSPRRQYLENLVTRYNNEYASKHGKKIITAEELVDASEKSKERAH